MINHSANLSSNDVTFRQIVSQTDTVRHSAYQTLCAYLGDLPVTLSVVQHVINPLTL